jgi:formamidopyrimidine-DNA glycosylase
MPELPEVQTVVNTLAPRLRGATFRRVTLARRDIVTPAESDLVSHLTGRTVTAISRRGKRIVFALDDGNRFFIHLGMTGRLTIEPARSDVPKHTHLLIDLVGRSDQLRFRDPRRFGGIWWLGTDSDDSQSMGPEPLSVRPQQLAKRLKKTRRAIKTALLDQRLVAGLGNIYVDEALFAAGIHPQTLANQLTPAQLRRLNRSIKTVLRRAIRHRGSTLRDYVDADGAAGAFQRLHRVYSREGAPCPNCKTPIARIVLGGRSTHFCPQCQKGPRARGAMR